MSDPKVSVVITVYNNEASIDLSVASIVGQTFTDWEMILWNDASTDGSLDKLLEWQARDGRIKVFSNDKNLGRTMSSNLAIEKSKGIYIARMDGDDIALPERLLRQVDFLDGNPQFSIVSSSCILFDKDGEWGVRYAKEKPQKEDFLWGSQFLHPSAMMRREALLHVGGYKVAEYTRRSGDYDLFMRLYAAGFAGYNIREPLLRYCEDRTPRRFRYSYRIGEAKVRYHGFKELGLLRRGLPYIIKPLVINLIPGKLKRRLQGRIYSASGDNT